MRPCFRAALAACALAPLAAAAQAETLGDAIALAYETNPQLQAARAQQRATDEEYVQAESGLRPTVSGQATSSFYSQAANQFGTPLTGITESISSGEVTASQTLYAGGRIAGKIDAAKADILAGRERLRGVEINVLQSVIGAYLDIRRDQAQLAIAADNAKVLARTLEETKARFDVGQLTRTDVAQSEARLALARSQLATAQATLAQADAAYAAVVGQNPAELAPEPPIAQLLPASLDAAFDAAENANPQIRQAEFTERASAARLAESKAQLRPQVSVSGTYGYNVTQETFQVSQTGIPASALTSTTRGPQAQFQANLTVPLSSGGLNLSLIRQAAEQNNVDRVNIETARRQTLQAVAQAWNQLVGARASLAADEQQVSSDTVALEGVTEEQKVGLRTILDVLNAQLELEQSQLTLVAARHDEYVAAAGVLAAMGGLDARALLPNEPIYDPRKNFDHVRHAPGWVPWEAAIGEIDRLGGPAPTPMPATAPPGETTKP
jgi:outer membrane protein